MKLLMITGLGSAKDLASGRKGAFYNTLEEFHKYWTRIDIIAPKNTKHRTQNTNKAQSTEHKTQTEILFGNVYIHVSPWPLIFHPFWFLKRGLEIYKEQKFDLMTVHDFPPFYNGIGARLLWNRIKIPYVLEFHHISGYPKAANLKEKIYASTFIWRFYWNLFGSKAKAVRVVNQKQTSEFLEKAGVSKEKIVYISSMYIDSDIFKPIGLPKEYDIIFVGRLEENKGITLLLKTLSILSKTHNLKPRTLIVGNGSLSTSLKLKVKSLKLENNVFFYGRAKDSEEIARLLNQSKVLIMSSYNEGGPRVVLEAMACGVPVLATNVGLMTDFADKNIVKIIDWSAEDIARKTKELLENEDERKRLGQVGLEIARKFEKKEMIKNYAEWLISVAIQQ